MRATPVLSCFRTCNFLVWRQVPLATFFFELRAVFKELYREICPYSFWLDFPVIVCPANSCSRTYYDLLKPIAFSFVGNFSQTLQFILCPVYYLRLVVFWTILTRSAASIASCFKVKSLSTFMDTVTIYFNSFLWRRLPATPKRPVMTSSQPTSGRKSMSRKSNLRLTSWLSWQIRSIQGSLIPSPKLRSRLDVLRHTFVHRPETI